MLKSFWPTKKLTDICDPERGTEPGSAFYVEASDKAIPFLRIGDLTGKIDAPKFVKNDNENLQIVDKNETLITFDGTPGIVVRGLKGAIASGIRVIRNLKPEIDGGFLFYYLQTPVVQKTIRAYSKGATIIHSSAAIPHIKIPLPPLKIQQKIVERLDAIKKAQELNDKQIELAEELFQSLLYRELDPKGKNWKARRLGEVCEEIYRYPTYYNIKYLKRGIPEIRGELIMKDGTINLNKKRWRFIDRSTSERFPKTQLKSGDVVLSVRGTIGKIGFVPKELEGSNMTANLMRISPNRKRLKPRYFWFFLRSNFFQKSLLNILSSTTITTLRAPALKSLKISFPPIEIQRKIVEKLSAVQDYKKKLLEQKQKLNELFESVLNKSMKEELIK